MTTPPNTWYRQWKRRNRWVPGNFDDYIETPAHYDEKELIIGGIEVMQEWERPLMRALAYEAARNKGSVLEIGFGMGISASYLVEAGCSEYTVIEPHPAVLERARAWAAKQPVPVRIVEGFWQDAIDGLSSFDGILFDPIAVAADESMERLYVPFIPHASQHLNPGGVFTFFSATSDRIPPKHLELLEQSFTECRYYNVTGLRPPKDCQYYQSSKMLVPVCIK